MRHRYDVQLRRAEQVLAGPELADFTGQDGDAEVVRAATAAARSRLFGLRADGTIGDAAFQLVEQELDWTELDWAQFLRLDESRDGAS